VPPAVEAQREDGGGERGDPLERHRENERRRKHKEEQHQVHHVRVLVRDGGGDDALASLESREHGVAVAVDVERGFLVDVAVAAVLLDNALDLRDDHVEAVGRINASVPPNRGGGLNLEKTINHMLPLNRPHQLRRTACSHSRGVKVIITWL
jgi:hypothetical protein